MTEGTHSAEAIYGLRKAIGKGARLWAGLITIAADDYTLDTGLDSIEGMSNMLVNEGTDIDGDTPIVAVSDVTGGTITFETGKLDAYGATAATGYLLVVGVAR